MGSNTSGSPDRKERIGAKKKSILIEPCMYFWEFVIFEKKKKMKKKASHLGKMRAFLFIFGLMILLLTMDDTKKKKLLIIVAAYSRMFFFLSYPSSFQPS